MIKKNFNRETKHKYECQKQIIKSKIIKSPHQSNHLNQKLNYPILIAYSKTSQHIPSITIKLL